MFLCLSLCYAIFWTTCSIPASPIFPQCLRIWQCYPIAKGIVEVERVVGLWAECLTEQKLGEEKKNSIEVIMNLDGLN